MIRYDKDSPEFAIQTAVMFALPHATHPMHGDWRTKADALIESLRLNGFEIVRVGESGAGS
jgi:hypothetical protein